MAGWCGKHNYCKGGIQMLICADIIEIEEIKNFFKENEGAKGDDVVHVSLPYGMEQDGRLSAIRS